MKRFFWVLLCMVMTITLAGCVTVKKVVRERVDQEPAGNKGYLEGSSSRETVSGPKDREYIDVRVEIPTWEEITRPGTKADAQRGSRQDAAVDGNKGYLTKGRGFEDELPQAAKRTKPQPKAYYEEEVDVEQIDEDTGLVYEQEAAVVASQKKAAVVAEQALYAEYKVQKGDTLSHIAKRFYGKASKWTVIYEANSDKIKDPTKLKAGIVLIIPELKEVEAAEFAK